MERNDKKQIHKEIYNGLSALIDNLDFEKHGKQDSYGSNKRKHEAKQRKMSDRYDDWTDRLNQGQPKNDGNYPYRQRKNQNQER